MAMGGTFILRFTHPRLVAVLLATLTALAWPYAVGALDASDDDPLDRDADVPRPWRPLGPEPHPYTTEPGTVQVEIDPLNYSTDRYNPHREPQRVHRFEVPVRVKFGLTHNVDLHIGGDAFLWEQVEDREARTSERDRGVGDLLLASKINLIGNDRHIEGGARSISLLPTLRLPTGRRDLATRRLEGGVKVPIAFEPVEGWEVEITPQFFGDRNLADDGHHFRFTHLVVVNREIVENVTGFVELEQVHRTEPSTRAETTLTTGLTLDVSERQVIEWGVDFGLTRAADDFGTFITLVQRF